MRECGICLFRIGWIDREVAERLRVNRKTATRWRTDSSVHQPDRVSDKRLFCVRCMFRLGAGVKKAMRATGLCTTVIRRFVKQQGLTDAAAAKQKVALDINRRKAKATSWMEAAWASEWRGMSYIGELKHWGKAAAMNAYKVQKAPFSAREWRIRNRDQIASKMKAWRRSAEGRAYFKRVRSEPMNKIANNIRRRLRDYTRSRGCTFIQLIGCTASDLRRHLEIQMDSGMGWHNYGKWHVDHIRPLASFDLRDPAQVREANHYTNLRPLWAVDNLRKGARWTIAA